VFAFQKAESSACAKQALGFRDGVAQIEAANAIVMGISTDTQEALNAWKAELDLPYDLLSDVAHTVLDEWGAWDKLSFKARNFNSVSRSFWVIDAEGVVVDAQIRITSDESVRRALLAIE